MNNIGILGLGHYLPKNVLTNFDLEKMVDTSDEWIFTRTGIKERRVASEGEKASDMAGAAAKEALKQAGVLPEELDLIIVATISPDSNFPAVACLVQKALGARSAVAFDISAACSGFLFAVTTAKQFLRNGVYRRALVIAAERFTHLLDWNDRSTCVLFGDGAGACVLGEVSSDRGIVADYLKSEGQYGHLLSVVMEDRQPLDQKTKTMSLPYIEMHGKELFKVAVNSMAEAVHVALERAGIGLKDVDCVVPHQANDRIISGVANKLGVSREKFFINIEKYGNMSAASIVVALYEAVEQGRVRPGDTVVLVAFGAGLVSAATILKWGR